MTTSKHTPGPWEANFSNGRWYVMPGNSGDAVSFSLPNSPTTRRPITETKANARLIAAAPEMLALLKSISFRLSGTVSLSQLENIRALLAKIEREPPNKGQL